jgi:hypothetical protein
MNIETEDKDEKKGFSWTAFFKAVNEFAFWSLIWSLVLDS